MISFESFELKQSYAPHLKVLMCGINASSAQWCGYIFIFHFSRKFLKIIIKKFKMVFTISDPRPWAKHLTHSEVLESPFESDTATQKIISNGPFGLLQARK